MESPFGDLLSEALEIDVLKLAGGGAGPGFWLGHPQADRVFEVVNRSVMVVVQVMSGRSSSCSQFVTDGTRMGVRQTDGVTMPAPEFVDWLVDHQPENIGEYIEETRTSYVEQMLELLSRIQPPTILFWFAKRKLDYQARHDDRRSIWGPFPHLVDREMIDRIRPHATRFVTCITRRGSPCEVPPLDGAGDARTNRYYPSAEMHEDAAAALEKVCRGLLPSERRPTPQGDRGRSRGQAGFVVIAPARSGSRTVARLLDLHPWLSVDREPFDRSRGSKGRYPYREEVDDAESLDRILDEILRKSTGFEHLLHHLPDDLNHRLLCRGELQRVFLYRNNLLQAIVSHEIERATCRSEPSGPPLQAGELEPLDLESIGRGIATLRGRLDAYRTFMVEQSLTFHALAYEELLSPALDETRKRIRLEELFGYLGVAPLHGKRLDAAKALLSPQLMQVDSEEETYRRIPNIDEVEERYGSSENGYLFRPLPEVGP